MEKNNIPLQYIDLFESKSFAHLATFMPDGSIQVNPVWVDYDGENILVNTARKRQKDLNMRRNPRVTVEIQDANNPYRYLEVRGRVVEDTEEGALQHIDKMAKKYRGLEKYPSLAPGEVRVIYKIKPEHVIGHG